MDLIIERYKETAEYTVSRLYERHSKKKFLLDVLEPPIRRLAPRREKKVAFDKGFYRLFVKSDKINCTMTTSFRKECRRPHFGFVSVKSSLLAEQADFNFRNSFIDAPLWLGRYCSETNTLFPDPEGYEIFLYHLIAEKQASRKINVQVI